jgi:hypothetical protein
MIERHWNADLLAVIFGLIFLAVGLIGFINNPLVSETGVFRVNDAHNVVHLVSGFIFLAGAAMHVPVMTIRVMAVLYALLTIVGFAVHDRMLFGVIEMNVADHWLHLVIAAVLLLVGFLTPARETMRAAH